MKIPDETVEKFCDALYATRGRITHAADRADIDYKTATKLLNRKRVKEVLEEIEQRNLDDGEAALMDAVQHGGFRDRSWSVPLLLKTKGKIRGFHEKVEVTTEPARKTLELVEVDDWRERK